MSLGAEHLIPFQVKGDSDRPISSPWSIRLYKDQHELVRQHGGIELLRRYVDEGLKRDGLVFAHEIDPSFPADQQSTLTQIHHGDKDGPVMRC